MQILISPAAVAFRRVIGTDDVLVLVVDVLLLVAVAVFVIVGGEEYTTRVEDCQCLSP